MRDEWIGHPPSRMRLDSIRAVARSMARSVGALGNYVMPKRCWRCQHLLGRRAMVCPYCRKWQA